MPRQPLSQPLNSRRLERYLFPALGTFLLLSGCLFSWNLFLQPLLQLIKARSWETTNCTILQSSIEAKKNENNTSYLPSVVYEYLANGKREASSRYSFFPTTGSYEWAEKIVAKYPAGSTHPCHYDPTKPSEAVLVTEFSGLGFWFNALFPCLFFVCGGMMLVLGLRSAKPKPLPPLITDEKLLDQRPVNEVANQDPASKNSFETLNSGQSLHPILEKKLERAIPKPYSECANWKSFVGPQKLLPTNSRIGTVLGLATLALLWNSGTLLFVFEPQRRQDWLSLLFMCPFLIFGISMAGMAIYSFLTLFNPTVELAISEGAVPLGDEIDVAWELKGRVYRIRELVIAAVAEEQATYTRGTDTKTDKRIFQTIEIIRTKDVAEMQFGTANVVIPLGTMHSHHGEKNKIVWKLTVQGDIPLFPNVNEEFEFRVIPRNVS